MDRHGITDINDPFNKKAKERRSTQSAEDRNVWNTFYPADLIVETLHKNLTQSQAR